MAANPSVNNVNLEVEEGAITFLLGPNGGGKTSLLKCVTGMVSVDHGSEVALKAENTTFGICPQNNVSLKCYS
jgi:ABC-type multidrug transport system ATPase subunit